jgi:hypothetical protein
MVSYGGSLEDWNIGMMFSLNIRGRSSISRAIFGATPDFQLRYKWCRHLASLLGHVRF